MHEYETQKAYAGGHYGGLVSAPGPVNAPQQATITDKAARVLVAIVTAERLAAQLGARVIPPQPEAASGEKDSPPSHIVFILEEAEQRMAALCQRLDHLSRLL